LGSTFKERSTFNKSTFKEVRVGRLWEEGGEGGIRKGKDLKNAKRVFQKTYIYLLFYVPLPLLCQVLDLRLKRDDFAVLDKEVEAKMEIAKLFDLHNYTKKVV
jgi:hypothetical protein